MCGEVRACSVPRQSSTISQPNIDLTFYPIVVTGTAMSIITGVNPCLRLFVLGQPRLAFPTYSLLFPPEERPNRLKQFSPIHRSTQYLLLTVPALQLVTTTSIIVSQSTLSPIRPFTTSPQLLRNFSANPLYNTCRVHCRGDWTGDDSSAGNYGGLCGIYIPPTKPPTVAQVRRRNASTLQEWD
jgi:hypothetical protein